MTESSAHGDASNALARLAEDGLVVKTGYARTRINGLHPELAGARAQDQGGFDAGAGGAAAPVGRITMRPTRVESPSGAGCVTVFG